MKKGISILFFTIIFCLAGKAQNLVGSWKTIINNDEIGFSFDSLGYATMKGEGETIGGEMFLMDGKRYYMKYSTNLSAKPYQLDMILFDYKTKKEIRRMLAIYSFTNDNKLQICLNTEDTIRPKDFKNKEACFKLTKVIKL
jgi:uncharacterized protein (TIGR03067 family)